MSSPAAASVFPELPASKSFASRLVGVFVSPRETFVDIARKPDFIAPLIASVVFTVATTETMLAKIGMDRILRQAMETNRQLAQMPPERIQQAAHIQTIIAHVTGFLGAPAFLLIVAAVGLLVANPIFGAQLNFRKAFSVSSYAYLVNALGALMAITTFSFADPEHFNPQSIVPTNPGFFLNPLETSKPLLAFASSLDLFSLWFMGLLGLGFSEAAGRKVKALSIFLVFFALWLIIVLGKVGLAMLG